MIGVLVLELAEELSVGWREEKKSEGKLSFANFSRSCDDDGFHVTHSVVYEWDNLSKFDGKFLSLQFIFFSARQCDERQATTTGRAAKQNNR